MRTSRPKLKSKLATSNTLDPPHKRIVRCPDPTSPNVTSVLRPLVPALMYKCIWYAFHPEDARTNLVDVREELDAKGDPRTWWVNTAKRALNSPQLASQVEWLVSAKEQLVPYLLT